MTDISKDNKILAKTILKVFGGSPQIHRYWDDAENSHVEILNCHKSPQHNLNSYATIGLSDHQLLVEGKPQDFRLEIVAACSSDVSEFPNILSTAAFCIINSKWSCFPGAVFPDVVEMFDCSKTMKHLMFVPPFIWENDLESLSLETKTIAWLLALPISEKEFQFVEDFGPARLEEVFQGEQIDIFNINRPSAV